MSAWIPGAAAQAHKDSSAELVGGVMRPLGEEDYEDFIDQSLKFGARFAFFGGAASAGSQVGLEFGFDWTPAANDLDDVDWVDASFNRFRVLAGARLRKGIGEKASIFFRAGAGVDFVVGKVEEGILGTDWEENDLGIGLEFGGGVAAHLGETLVGFHVALPIAFHWEDDPENYDYTGYDLDLLFMVGRLF